MAIVLSIAGVAYAQQGTADIRGVVTDQQGAVLPGVTVTARNQDTGMFRETVSNADGTFFMSGIVPGRYEITADLAGFRKSVQRNVLVEVGRTSSVDVQMAVGGLEEALTVTAESPLVDITSKEVGGNISSRELIDLPSINRNYIGFVGLLPGIIPNISTESFGSDSINVNGQDARNNNYMLDGANNNDDVIGQRAGTQARTPLESIQEFQVITNQFDAEFGRTTGAVINAVTKQGSNAFRGSGFGYWQDASFTEKTYFAERDNLDKPDTKNQQFGGTIGGPIVRDKAHFFASVERVLIDEGIDVTIPARADLSATTTEQTRVWNTLVRFDHQISANHTWGVRWLRETSPQLNQIIESNNRPVTLAASREEDDLDQTVVGTLSSVLGNTKVNTLRFGFTQEDVAFANPAFNSNGRRQDLLPPTLVFLTYVDQQSSTAQARVNNAFQLEDTFSWFLPGKGGDHDIKFGIQAQYSTNNSDTQDNLNGTFTFRGNTPFNPADPSTYPERLQVRVPGANVLDMNATYFSAFAQDKWRLGDRFTLSVGVRYDLEDIPIEEVDNPRFADVNDYPRDVNNFAPRVGFSYDVAGDGRQVVRGGYGQFYDKTHFELITGIITGGVFSNSFNVNFPANAADPGPSRGQLPADPFLVNGPTVNRDLLAQRFPAGSRLRNTGTVNLDNPDRGIPYTHQLTVGYERQLATNMSWSADYVHAMARDLFMLQDLNPGLRDTPDRTATLRRIDPAFVAAVNTPVNAGETDYDALQMQVEKRYSNNWSARASYTLAYSRGNTSGAGNPTSGFQLLNDLRLDLNEGPTNVDRRHNFVLSGSTIVPRTGGMTFSWVAAR
jgi:Carboxypeptidase regulatory-like domain/TonB dependent receptor/TonB-dependent Receptor Plug Domain